MSGKTVDDITNVIFVGTIVGFGVLYVLSLVYIVAHFALNLI